MNDFQNLEFSQEQAEQILFKKYKKRASNISLLYFTLPVLLVLVIGYIAINYLGLPEAFIFAVICLAIPVPWFYEYKNNEFAEKYIEENQLSGGDLAAYLREYVKLEARRMKKLVIFGVAVIIVLLIAL